jgi:phosphoribosylformimino-5-aminoimidazole carboxamide ribotide isomerase
MLIIPAIDIFQGNVVRLFQGDFNKVTYYPFTPVEIAQHFLNLGYKRLHVIDLEGAKIGQPKITTDIEAILRLGAEVQVGGGIRAFKDAKTYLDIGVNSIIISTRAISDHAFVDMLLKHYTSDNVIVSLDVKNGKLAIKGWQEECNSDLAIVIRQLMQQGIKNIIITDIMRDGTMTSVDCGFYKQIILGFPKINFYAAGGVSGYDDIAKLKTIPLAGVIVGKAFYGCASPDVLGF